VTQKQTIDRRADGDELGRAGFLTDADRSRIVVLIPRGEAIRNFVYSGAVRELNHHARVSLWSVIQDQSILGRFESDMEEVAALENEPFHPAFQSLLNFIDLVHLRMLGTVNAKELWARRGEQKLMGPDWVRRKAVNGLTGALSNNPALDLLTRGSQFIAGKSPGTARFRKSLEKLRPALVFNGSHIHGPASARPLAAARRLGIPTAGFIFSWDNLTTRGRIKDSYDYYLVWHQRMKEELTAFYPSVSPNRVFVTGTPQFDFHFDKKFTLDRVDLCARMGLDPARPFILYTTGVNEHFPEEHRTVEFVARAIQNMTPAPQLLVRTYIKGTSQEMLALARKNLPGVIFPPVLWKSDALTPMYEDISIYNSLLRHCSLGVNAASTVSLELMMYDKPVINLGFDPPGSQLGRWNKFERHLRLDHYRPVAESGAVMIARSPSDLDQMIRYALANPGAQAKERGRFLREMFGDTLDGNSAKRVAQTLASLARKELRR